jgi:hypothetical protein
VDCEDTIFPCEVISDAQPESALCGRQIIAYDVEECHSCAPAVLLLEFARFERRLLEKTAEAAVYGGSGLKRMQVLTISN